MTPTTFNLRIGDSGTFRVPMTWDEQPFSPGEDWTLILSAKESANDEDEDSVFQKALGVGIGVNESTAVVSVVPVDTSGQTPKVLVVDIVARNLEDGRIHAVSNFRISLLRRTTRGIETVLPIYTAQPPVPAAGPPGTVGGEDGDAFGTVPNESGGRDLTLWNQDTAQYVRIRVTGSGANQQIAFIDI